MGFILVYGRYVFVIIGTCCCCGVIDADMMGFDIMGLYMLLTRGACVVTVGIRAANVCCIVAGCVLWGCCISAAVVLLPYNIASAWLFKAVLFLNPGNVCALDHVPWLGHRFACARTRRTSWHMFCLSSSALWSSLWSCVVSVLVTLGLCPREKEAGCLVYGLDDSCPRIGLWRPCVPGVASSCCIPVAVETIDGWLFNSVLDDDAMFEAPAINAPSWL